MRTNTKVRNTRRTHGGGAAAIINKEQELRRSVMSCLLWEKEFYESGVTIAERIASLVGEVAPEKVAAIAIEAREEMNLRHVPLWIVRAMAKNHYPFVRETLARVIQRADELTEFLSLYWMDGKQPLAKGVQRGLADAFGKFDEYALAKYDSSGKVKLKDVLFMVHPKPEDQEQARLWSRLVDGKLRTPDTWETNLSAGEDKKATFERLIRENKLGALAFLRNLRNMREAGVDKKEVFEHLAQVDMSRVLPFRFIAAAEHNPEWEDGIEKSMLSCFASSPKLPGRTIFVVDVSGSMRGRLSDKSEMDRMDSAISLAILAKGLCEDVVIYATAGDDHRRVHATKVVPSAREGFAVRDAIRKLERELGGGGIFLVQVMDYIDKHETQKADRAIVFTDEQDCDSPSNNPSKAKMLGETNYIVNISSTQNGIAYDKWTHINGFSDAVLNYIRVAETVQN
jgi:60 kDa SS-A/Ro ribonucleoprotein